MKSQKKSTSQHNAFYYQLNSGRTPKSWVGFVMSFLIQWCRYYIHSIKNTEDFSHRKINRVIGIAGFIVFIIALIEAASLDGQKNRAAALVLNKPPLITQLQNTQVVAHQG